MTLRAHAAPLLARIGGRAIAVTTDGRTAAAIGMTAPDHLVLPDDPGPGEIWLPSLGRATVEPVPGGWLIRLATTGPSSPGRPSTVRLPQDPLALLPGSSAPVVADARARR